MSLCDITSNTPLSLMEAMIRGEVLSPSDPAAILLCLCAFYIVTCFVMSVITGNCSQVDKLWSITPWSYVLVILGHHLYYKKESDPVNIRLVVMFCLSFVWGLRLTYNFSRRDGYSGGEDYRWPILRKKMNWFLFLIFNITFISFYQHVLLLLTAMPAYIVGYCSPLDNGSQLNATDIFAGIFFFSMTILETLADNEQYEFQEEKWRKKRANEKLVGDELLGFKTTGLFKYSRHPNFFAEQSQWWAFYIFSVACTGQYLNWTILGAFLLSLLFQGSCRFTESITVAKYHMYAEYQKTTSSMIPWFPGKSLTYKKQE